LATESLRRPKCPRCSGNLLVAEESRFNARGHVDHDWSCDDCGHQFVTSVRLWRRLD
jgi:DNA-directed RNA polymerase subunit RPC12/RpoP